MPWAGKFCLLVVSIDLYPGEKRLGQQAPHIRPADPVGLGCPEHQVSGSVVELHDAFATVLGVTLFPDGLVKLPGDALLLSPEHIHRDGLGVGHLHQLHALVLEARNPPPRPLEPGGLVGVTYHQCVELVAHSVSVELVQLDPLRPGLLDSLLDIHHGQVRQIAAFAAVPPLADEVIELAPVTPAGGVLQPRSAPATGQQSPQVVVVTAGPEHVLVTLLEDHLHSLEQLCLYECWVVAGVLDAAIGDDSEVVPVA